MAVPYVDSVKTIVKHSHTKSIYDSDNVTQPHELRTAPSPYVDRLTSPLPLPPPSYRYEKALLFLKTFDPKLHRRCTTESHDGTKQHKTGGSRNARWMRALVSPFHQTYYTH